MNREIINVWRAAGADLPIVYRSRQLFDNFSLISQKAMGGFFPIDPIFPNVSAYSSYKIASREYSTFCNNVHTNPNIESIKNVLRFA